MSSSRVFTVTISAPFGNQVEAHLSNFLNTFALAASALDVEVEYCVETVHKEEPSEWNNFKERPRPRRHSRTPALSTFENAVTQPSREQ